MLEDLKRTHALLSFIHGKMLCSTYLPEDFKQADEALKLIQSIADPICVQIEELMKQEASDVQTEE